MLVSIAADSLCATLGTCVQDIELSKRGKSNWLILHIILQLRKIGRGNGGAMERVQSLEPGREPGQLNIWKATPGEQVPLRDTPHSMNSDLLEVRHRISNK